MKTLCGAAALVIAAATASCASANLVTDGSFETPDIANFAYNASAAGGAWTFLQNSGLIDPPSSFGAPAAPDGDQVAFLQSDFTAAGFGSFSQTINVALDGVYSLAYLDAGRDNFGSTGNLNYEVLLDAVVIVDNVGTTTGQPFTARLFNFAATAGTHTLTFRVDPTQAVGDNTAFFDQVSVTAVPEAGAWAFLLVAATVSRLWTWRGLRCSC